MDVPIQTRMMTEGEIVKLIRAGEITIRLTMARADDYVLVPASSGQVVVMFRGIQIASAKQIDNGYRGADQNATRYSVAEPGKYRRRITFNSASELIAWARKQHEEKQSL
jgi:hypothetical protein